MGLFESMLVLVLVAIFLLQVSRHLSIPYPTMLAMAGVIVAAMPWAPDIAIDPQLALALFIAPALLDAAYDLPPRELRRHWLPLVALAAVAVLLTTAAVAWAAVALAGLPFAAAIALGAIVAPPDAAAAAAVLSRLALPRRTVSILKGESILNDAVALLIFSATVGAVSAPGGLSNHLPGLALAVPGGLAVGLLMGKLHVMLLPRLAGTLGGTLFEFATTFAAWVIAERLHLSAILSVVAFAMIVARYTPEHQSPRDRVHSHSVWGAVVFLLNVLAFLLMGLQAHAIIMRFSDAELWQAAGFAGIVFAVVVIVRIIWVHLYNRLVHYAAIARGGPPGSSIAQAVVVSWCGMRGLVTMATALALPLSFPSRDLIVLSAFAVVLGTLIVQGMTLGPLIRLLQLKPDESLNKEISSARMKLLDAAVASLGDPESAPAKRIRADYDAERLVTTDVTDPQAATHGDELRIHTIQAQRSKLAELRNTGKIDDDVYYALEQQLDWAELAALPPERSELIEG